ncbi:MAG TPA: hypothetical protein G4O16_04085 [Dehalococcoidia bacterium]|nr:hypothetical protein [Dehalococcoidia bacterium]
MVKGLSVLVIVLGIVSIAIGGIFLGQAFAKNDLLVTAMQQEQITLGIPSEQLAEGEVIDSAREAEIAGDTVREHRHSIAPTYGYLLGGAQYDPTNPVQLTYAQALNLENYLYLAVLGFGVTQIAMGAGAFMVVTGIALGVTGVLLLRKSSS